MRITKELLKNLELKYGDLSAERCAEINEMKIKNPYYPWAYFRDEFFVAKNEKTRYFDSEYRVFVCLIGNAFN